MSVVCKGGSRAKNWCLTGWIAKGAKPLEEIWAGTKLLAYLGGQKEKSKDGKVHWQAWCQFKKRVRFAGVTKLFPSEQWHHEVVKDVKAMKTYVSKEESRVGDSFVEFGEHTEKGKATAWQDLADSVLAKEATKRSLWVDHHAVMSTRFKAAYEMMSVLNATADVAEYKLESFDWEPITDWSKSVVLWGDSQIGKTQFALAHFEHPLMVSHIDKLATFDPRMHDGIVFDDMSFGHTPRSAQIHLVDINNSREIHVRYVYASIPAHTKKIFTTNVEEGAIFNMGDDAITNRLRVVHCEGDHSNKKKQRVHGWVGAESV